VKGKHIRFRDLDSSHSSHSHSSDWQEHSVPPGFDPQGNVSVGSAQDMSTSSVHYDEGPIRRTREGGVNGSR
jgi:hypothetical protein